MSLRLPRDFSGPLNDSHTKQPKPHMSVELEVEEFLHNGDLPSPRSKSNSPLCGVLHFGRIVFFGWIVDFQRWRDLYRNDCLIMLIAGVDSLHELQPAELPLAAGVYKHRPY